MYFQYSTKKNQFSIKEETVPFFHKIDAMREPVD